MRKTSRNYARIYHRKYCTNKKWALIKRLVQVGSSSPHNISNMIQNWLFSSFNIFLITNFSLDARQRWPQPERRKRKMKAAVVDFTWVLWLTAADVTDEREKRRSDSRNFRARLSRLSTALERKEQYFQRHQHLNVILELFAAAFYVGVQNQNFSQTAICFYLSSLRPRVSWVVCAVPLDVVSAL